MSIINQMLKDLNKRQSRQEGDEQNPLSGLNANHAPKDKKKKIILLILLAILVLIALYSFFGNSSKEKSKTIKATTSNLPTTLSSETIRKRLDKGPSVLNGVTISPLTEDQINQIQSQELTLNFDNATPKFHIQKDLAHHKLILDLLDSESNSPLTIHDNSIISKLLSNSDNDTITLTLTLIDSISNIDIKQTDKSLIIMLTASTNAEPTHAEVVVEEPQVIQLSPEQQRQEAYDNALSFIESGSIKQATLELQDILNKTPNFLVARNTLATLYLQNNDITNANKQIDEGLKLTPKDVTLVTLKARILLNQGDESLALTTLQTISPELKQAPDYYATLAATQQRLGNYAYAAQYYRQLTSDYPGHGVWWLGLGIALQASGQNNDALHAYQRAVNTQSLKPNLLAFARTQINSLAG